MSNNHIMSSEVKSLQSRKHHTNFLLSRQIEENSAFLDVEKPENGENTSTLHAVR